MSLLLSMYYCAVLSIRYHLLAVHVHCKSVAEPIDLCCFAVPPFLRISNLPATKWHSHYDCNELLMLLDGCALQVKEDDEAELARQQSTRVA